MQQEILYQLQQKPTATGKHIGRQKKTTQQHSAIWHVAATAGEAVELVHTVPLWDASIRKFAAI